MLVKLSERYEVGPAATQTRLMLTTTLGLRVGPCHRHRVNTTRSSAQPVRWSGQRGRGG